MNQDEIKKIREELAVGQEWLWDSSEIRSEIIFTMTNLVDEVERLQEGLKIQRKAALSGMDAARKSGMDALRIAERVKAESSPDALESERSANSILTEENESFRAKLKVAEDALLDFAEYDEQRANKALKKIREA